MGLDDYFEKAKNCAKSELWSRFVLLTLLQSLGTKIYPAPFMAGEIYLSDEATEPAKNVSLNPTRQESGLEKRPIFRARCLQKAAIVYIPSSLSLTSLSSCKKKTFFPKQFPSVTICPGRNNRPDHWAFIESLYSVVDPGSSSVKEIFGFIPHAVLRHRFEVNLQSLEAEEDEEFLEVMLKETFEQISLFPEHQPSENIFFAYTRLIFETFRLQYVKT